MTRLPVIVGFGGINAAGRSSFHHAYRRMVADALPEAAVEPTYLSLQRLMGLEPMEDKAALRQFINDNTLVRRIHSSCFDTGQLQWHRRFQVAEGEPLTFTCLRSTLPKRMPVDWETQSLDSERVQVTIPTPVPLFVPSVYESAVKAAGQLPTGFLPGGAYASHNHPRGLQMTVFGASDAIDSIGIDWETLKAGVSPGEIGVYAGSAMGQMDFSGNGGLLTARRSGLQPTSRQCALGFAQMPADFINAYLIGNVGHTSSNLGACASFLYNLHQAVRDIQAGRIRIAIVGNSEAPLTSEIVEGYAAMGALATDEALLALDKADGATQPDHRRASRPFGPNCGFVLAESAQYVVLFDDALAMELGATIYGAVNDVFIHADGYKRSISSPGVGNYVTLARAVAAARQLVGEEAIRHRSFVQAHGSSTPQNRVTESHILDTTAKAFDIHGWPVGAVKCYLGHSLGAAAGDQLTASLGVWEYGFIPGIATIDRIADDVHAERLQISASHKEVGREGMDVAFINAKGFGGNNATTSVLGPHVVRKMLGKRFGAEAMSRYFDRNENVRCNGEERQAAIVNGSDRPIYRFGDEVRGAEDVEMDAQEIRIRGYGPIALGPSADYADLCDF